jgi:hypothetical protein
MPAAELPDWIARFQPDELWSLATAFQWSREDLPMLISEVDHKRWKKSLYAYLQGDEETCPPLDHHHCRFGQWFYSPDSRRYAAVEAFKSLEAMHFAMHEIGRQMVRLHEMGDQAAVNALKADLEKQSGRLSDTIQQVQAEVLMGAQSGRR